MKIKHLKMESIFVGINIYDVDGIKWMVEKVSRGIYAVRCLKFGAYIYQATIQAKGYRDALYETIRKG